MLRFAVALAVAAIPGVGTARSAASLCVRGETPLFACAIGARRVAVCGGAAGAVYRYGRPGRVELEARGLRFARRAYSGGGESQVSVRRGRFTYVVYDSIVRTAFGADGRNDPAMSAGLAVIRGGRTISDRQCRGVATLDEARARRLPAGNFVER